MSSSLVDAHDQVKFHERLRAVVSTESQNAFAKKAGISQSTFNRIWNGALPSLEHLVAISEVAGVSLDWLVRGAPKAAGSDRTAVPIPKLRVSRHNGATQDDSDEPIFLPDCLLDGLKVKLERARYLRMVGSALEPVVDDGDVLLVDTSATETSDVADGAIYVFALGSADHPPFVRRLRRSPNGWIMKADNAALFPAEELIPLTRPIVILGRVRWVGGAI